MGGCSCVEDRGVCCGEEPIHPSIDITLSITISSLVWEGRCLSPRSRFSHDSSFMQISLSSFPFKFLPRLEFECEVGRVKQYIRSPTRVCFNVTRRPSVPDSSGCDDESIGRFGWRTFSPDDHQSSLRIESRKTFPVSTFMAGIPLPSQHRHGTSIQNLPLGPLVTHSHALSLASSGKKSDGLLSFPVNQRTLSRLP